MAVQPLVNRQVHSSKSTQASLAVSAAAASAGAQMGHPHGLGLGTMPPTQAIAGHAMSGQMMASEAPASVRTHVGQPQDGVTTV
jgi:hypothetical protein